MHERCITITMCTFKLLEIYGIYTIRLDDVYWSIRNTLSGLNRFVVLVSTHFFSWRQENKWVPYTVIISCIPVYLLPTTSWILHNMLIWWWSFWEKTAVASLNALKKIGMHKKNINPFNFNLVSVACGYRPRSASVAVMWFDIRERVQNGTL